MQVSELLESKGAKVITTPPQVAVSALSRTLQDERIGAALVQGSDGALMGIISERDIVHSIAEKGPTALELPVSELMTSPVVTCGPDTNLEELMQKMIDGRIRHLPVIEDGSLIGIISIGDVVKGVVNELKWVKNALQQQVMKSAAWSTDED